MSVHQDPEYQALLRRYEREKHARQQAETILEQKSAELFERNEELSTLTHRLEQQVEERTRDLADTRDQALQATRAKSDFIANMSHEIRTPLNGVLGILGMLAGTPLSDAQQRLVTTATESGQHLLGIINDILDFSKIESGKMKLDAEPVDVTDLLQQGIASLQVVARNKGLHLVLQIEPGFPAQVLGDALRLRQILLNLLSNAIKFTPSGRVLVRLWHDKRFWYLAVEDSGIGMSQQQCQQIFNAFDQGDTSITRRFGGTGLGLTITQRLTRLMQGELTVSSVPDQGSCFTVGLPLRVVEVSERHAAIPARSGPVRFAGQAVLLVEDNEVNQLIARHLLEKLNLVVTCARNGVEALAAVAEQPFACILMDLQMPVMDGLEATRRLRAMTGPVARTPVIAMTAHATEEHRLESLGNGMDEHLTKPIVAAQLQATLARYIGAVDAASADPELELQDPAVQLLVMDEHQALARLGGNRLLFAELLGTFVREHESDAARICAALARGDRHSALVRLHSLAGSAGNIGASALANVALMLENRLAASPLMAPEDIRSELEPAWASLLASIQNADGTLSVMDSGAMIAPCSREDIELDTSSPLDMVRVTAECQKMYDWLHQDLVQVDEILNTLLLQPLPPCLLGNLSQLHQLLSQFCIEDAESLLEQMITHLHEVIAHE